MAYWRMNTNKDARKDVRTCDLWHEYGMAFAGDHEGKQKEHAKRFDELRPGDGIFMHESGKNGGLISYGIVQEYWDMRSYKPQYSFVYNIGHPKEVYEYRIRVKWLKEYDRRNSPLKIGQFKLPQLKTLDYIDKNKHNVDRIMELLHNSTMCVK